MVFISSNQQAGRFFHIEPPGSLKALMNPNPAPHRPAGPVERLADFLALRPGAIGVLGMVVLVGMGERMTERFLPIYILALGGAFLWMISPQVNLWTAFGFGVVGTVGFALFGRDAKKIEVFCLGIFLCLEQDWLALFKREAAPISSPTTPQKTRASQRQPRWPGGIGQRTPPGRHRGAVAAHRTSPESA